MGWAIGYDENWKRDIGYGVPAFCDHPGCRREIDRGLSYVCAEQEPYGGNNGCGLFFCPEHAANGKNKCQRCVNKADPFEAKPDHPKWIEWKLTDISWEPWRNENPGEVAKLLAQVQHKPSQPNE